MKMGKSAGLLSFAALLIVAISVLTWWLYPTEPELLGDAGYEEARTVFHPGGYDCQARQIDAVPAPKRTERRSQCEAMAEEHRLQVNDLLQQRRAASAAEASAAATYSQTRIAAWGLLLGGLTMGAAIAAAYYARSAALHAEQTAVSFIEAERAVLHARRADVGFMPADSSYPVSVSFTNRGRSAARIVDFSFTGPGFAAASSREQLEATIAGGAEGCSTVLVLKDAVAGEYGVDCIVTYRTIGNRRYTSHFRIVLERKRNAPGFMAWTASTTHGAGHPDDT